jgi:hypothetical protein
MTSLFNGGEDESKLTEVTFEKAEKWKKGESAPRRGGVVSQRNLVEYKIDAEKRFWFVPTPERFLIFDDKKNTRYPVDNKTSAICLYDEETGSDEPNACYIFYRTGEAFEEYEEVKGRQFVALIDMMRQDSTPLFLIKQRIAENYNVQMVILKTEHDGCSEYFESKNPDMIQKLEELNARLCKQNLHLEFDLKYNLTNNVAAFSESDLLTLCLYHKTGNCVSSIQLQFEPKDYISIKSYTEEAHENKKYNSLLCSAIIILSPYFTCKGRHYGQLHSFALHPKSAYILNNTYNLIFESSEEHAQFNQLKGKSSTEFQTFWDSLSGGRDIYGVHILIPITLENLAIAEAEFTRLSAIVCTRFEAGSKRRKTRRRKKSIRKHKKI